MAKGMTHLDVLRQTRRIRDEMLSTGASTKSLAAKYGIEQETLRQRLHALGVYQALRNKREEFLKAVDYRIVALRAEGRTIRETAAILEKSFGFVQKRLNKMRGQAALEKMAAD